MQTENCTLCFFIFICVFIIVIVSLYLPGVDFLNTFHETFHFCVCSYFCYCLFLFIWDSLSSHLLSGLLSLSVIFGCFMTFEAFYFSHRFPIVNSAIVEIFKLAIFCTNIVQKLTHNQISFRIAIVCLYKIWLVWWLLWKKTYGCYGTNMQKMRRKN